ncbi:MAG: cytochrome c biogenesis protein [Parachlamydiaceae bacterium]
MRKFLISFAFFSYHLFLFGDFSSVPVSYKGRIRPLESYADLLFYDLYHANRVKTEDLDQFPLHEPLDILFSLYLNGYRQWENVPLIWVGDRDVKRILDLSIKGSHFSYYRIKQAFKNHPESLKIIAQYFYEKNALPSKRTTQIKEISPDFLVDSDLSIASTSSNPPWNQLAVGDSIKSDAFNLKLAENLIKTLQKVSFLESFKGITSEEQSPMAQSSHFHLIPGRYQTSEWVGLARLPQSKKNFTIYSDIAFQKIRDSFLQLLSNTSNPIYKEKLATSLQDAYQEIAASPLIKGTHRQVYYPSKWQLWLEKWYTKLPLTTVSIIGYLATIFFLLGFQKNLYTKYLGAAFFLIAFLVQLGSLLARSLILMRPPVSNMFETVIYVPWIGALMGLLLAKAFMSRWPIIASSLLAAILLAVLEISDLNTGLDNVQAVLNSHFWLVIHVLMIVASYGVLILAGVFGHLYLISLLTNFKEKELIASCLVQTLYIGTALLIPGTILGGVWAAQSWGRFWDWDPKESWAFISICAYLILIHLYRFNKLQIKGLSFGSILGLGIISFTWYGVNYVLGTGMHTYGFGSGSHVYYILFLLVESVFLIYMALKLQKISCVKHNECI